MTERRLASLADVILDADPLVALITDFFAVHAGGKNAFEMSESGLQTDDAFGDQEAGPQFIGIALSQIPIARSDVRKPFHGIVGPRSHTSERINYCLRSTSRAPLIKRQ